MPFERSINIDRQIFELSTNEQEVIVYHFCFNCGHGCRASTNRPEAKNNCHIFFYQIIDKERNQCYCFEKKSW